MGGIFYRLFLLFYGTGIRVYAWFNPKAKLWLQGRRDLFANLNKAFEKNESPVIWFHCASLGEFEQGRPVMELLKETYPGYKLLLTFFSPSGYEVQKDYPGADYIFYLPFDSPANAKKFLSITKPSLVVFVKYEFWYFFLKQIYREKIPLLLISAVFRPQQPFFKWYGGLHREMLSFFTNIFVQDTASARHLDSIGTLPVTVSGDTRFDRVWEIRNKKHLPIPFLDAFVSNQPVVVAGSTWPEDESVLQTIYNNLPAYVKMIIAPHEISETNLSVVRSLFEDSLFYSELKNDEEAAKARVLIIDNVGMLSRLYQFATITYVGGGFSKDGIHNILEAAVWGKPVVFGPNYKKYQEATGLIDAGGASSFNTQYELLETLNKYLSDPELLQKRSEAAGKFVASKRGATDKIAGYVQEKRLLTNL